VAKATAPGRAKAAPPSAASAESVAAGPVAVNPSRGAAPIIAPATAIAVRVSAPALGRARLIAVA